ncbi:MAG: hypothetical protein KatS3mg057_0688 [Herpetosiphonaceae bacterium]|nr:MAG: hypothetical protein KatS3mg057_0688 [Herpetosiphonaceae bacterium]
MPTSAQQARSGAPQCLTPLVWVIFAIPFFTFWGWLIARPAERWRALAGCLAMYFFTVFIAARIEHLILGREQARLTGHNLYFNAVIICQLLVAVFIALQRAWSPGTRRDSQA